MPNDGLIHVTSTVRRQTQLPVTIRVHRRQLISATITRHLNMPITTRTQSILDCIASLPLHTATTMFDRALQQRWLDSATVTSYLADCPRRPGNSQLRRLLLAASSGARSAAEPADGAFGQQAGLNGWRANAPVRTAARTYEVDLVFAEFTLAIETMAGRTTAMSSASSAIGRSRTP